MFFLCDNILIISFFYSSSIEPSNAAARLLSRRYALTSTGYKFLEIGINVGPPSYVEIVVGDHRGQNIAMSLEMWKGLFEQRWNVYKMLRNEYKDNFINVGPLTISVSAMKDFALVRLESSNVRMQMTESTLRRMLDLDECVDVTFERLFRLIDEVDVKYTRFSNIAATVARPEDAANAIRDSDTFDRRKLVDCELLALVFGTHERKKKSL